jgi:hypothetical protein
MRTLLKGFNADGRTLGLGLAVAMRKQRDQATRDVEDYLRRETDERPVTVTSA